MLKSKITGSVQEVILPDFPDDDNTVTATVTKSRRVSFGTNLVKEFIVGSAVSSQCLPEYEQAFPSSDSSNADSSQSGVESGILDHRTFVVHESNKVHKPVPPVEPDVMESRPKFPKFSSTVCFSADSPTADMEFTEGCITLAKSILDKKNKEMTVIIQAKPKESKDNEKQKEEETKYFDGSQFDMSMTRCLKSKVNKREEKKCESEKTKIFSKYENEMSITKCNRIFNAVGNDSSWEESKENRMPLDMIMRHLDKDTSDLDDDLFNPEKTFTNFLSPFDTSSESEKLNLNESMEISSDFPPNIMKLVNNKSSERKCSHETINTFTTQREPSDITMDESFEENCKELPVAELVVNNKSKEWIGVDESDYAPAAKRQFSIADSEITENLKQFKEPVSAAVIVNKSPRQWSTKELHDAPAIEIYNPPYSRNFKTIERNEEQSNEPSTADFVANNRSRLHMSVKEPDGVLKGDEPNEADVERVRSQDLVETIESAKEPDDVLEVNEPNEADVEMVRSQDLVETIESAKEPDDVLEVNEPNEADVERVRSQDLVETIESAKEPDDVLEVNEPNEADVEMVRSQDLVETIESAKEPDDVLEVNEPNEADVEMVRSQDLVETIESAKELPKETFEADVEMVRSKEDLVETIESAPKVHPKELPKETFEEDVEMVRSKEDLVETIESAKELPKETFEADVEMVRSKEDLVETIESAKELPKETFAADVEMVRSKEDLVETIESAKELPKETFAADVEMVRRKEDLVETIESAKELPKEQPLTNFEMVGNMEQSEIPSLFDGRLNENLEKQLEKPAVEEMVESLESPKQSSPVNVKVIETSEKPSIEDVILNKLTRRKSTNKLYDVPTTEREPSVANVNKTERVEQSKQPLLTDDRASESTEKQFQESFPECLKPSAVEVLINNGSSDRISTNESDDAPTTEREPSLVDVKVIESLEEQSKEPHCVWSLKDVRHPQVKSPGWLSFNCKILESSATVQFTLKISNEDSLDSCSTVTNSKIIANEEKSFRLPEYKLVVEFGFEKLKKFFEERRIKVDTIRRIPYFLDEINSFTLKTNAYLKQVYSILTLYPGSRLRGSLLSFRLYSFPVFFSSVISIDLSDLFRLSSTSLSFEDHFGHLNKNKIKEIFKDCLKLGNSLCEFIIRSTKYIIDLEKESGFVSKRKHIRLLPDELM